MKSLESIIPQHLAAAIGETLMHSIWQLAAITGLLVITLLFVQRKNARLRYALSTGALGLMLALPVGTFFYLFEPAAAQPAATELASTLSGIGFLPVATSETTLLEQVTAFFNQYAHLIFGLWCIGASFFALRFVGGFYQVQRLRRRQTVEVPAEVQALFEQLMDRMGIRQSVQLKQSRLIDSPLVAGVFKPMVLLPVGLLSGLTTEQVECILTHELAHVRRWDYLVNVLQSMAEILLFFHPAVWFVSKMVREERENACDQIVLDVKNNSMVYARALLNLEVFRSDRPRLALRANGGKLFERIQRITGSEVPTQRRYTRGLFLGLFTMLLILMLTTTSKDQIKASIPFLSEIAPELQFAEEQTPLEEWENGDQHTGDENGGSEGSNDQESTESHAFSFDFFDGENDDFDFETFFASLPTTAQDSPITKIIMVMDGENVEVSFDSNGSIASITKNGQQVSGEEFDQYKSEMDRLVIRRQSGGNTQMSHITLNMPNMPRVGKIPPMPALPKIDFKGMPTPPAPPANMEDDEKAMKRYEAEMEAYGEEMEEWGERFEEQFEEGEWENYEEEMEEWGNRIELHFDGEEWEEFGEAMEEWGERFGKKMEDKFSREWTEEGEQWEEFAEEMERMGEEIGVEIARMFEDGEIVRLERKMERLGEKIEREVEAEMRKMERELERAETVQELAEDAMERAKERQEEAEERRRETRELQEEARLAGGVNSLRRALERDELADDNESFRLKINNEELFINGKRQAKSTHRKYMELIEREMDIPVDSKDFVEINFKKRKNTVKTEIER